MTTPATEATGRTPKARSLQERKTVHSVLSSGLGDLDDDSLRALFPEEGEGTWAGWAGSTAATVGEHTVFIKRIPVTDAEMGKAGSTRNHFRLPCYYHYGVGSAGFGAFRELAAHLKVTDWILAGAAEGFPLLYHHRLVRRSRPIQADMGGENYVRYWNSSPGVAGYMAARAAATWEIWLVCEHLPHMMARWLPDNQNDTEKVIGDLCSTISVLRSHGIVHFDAHFGNVVTEGEKAYLSDFGLWVDPEHELDQAERRFLQSHSTYDYGEAISGIADVLTHRIFGLGEADRNDIFGLCGVAEGAAYDCLVIGAVDHVGELQADGRLGLTPCYATAVQRYRNVIVYVTDLFARLRTDHRKSARFDDVEMRRLLEEAAVQIE